MPESSAPSGLCDPREMTGLYAVMGLRESCPSPRPLPPGLARPGGGWGGLFAAVVL